MKKKTISLIIVVVLLIGLLSACGGGGGGDQPADGGEARGVKLFMESIPPTLDPYNTVAYTSWYIWNQVYETLVHVEDDGSITPFLATGYTVSDDGLTYTFTLPQGVKFHNGEELKASDVAYSFNTAITRPAINSYVFMVDHAEAKDDYTVDIVLNQLYPAVLTMFANVPIVNEQDYKAAGEDYTEWGVGTGPYMYREGGIDLNTEITLDSFPDYRLGQASIPSVTFKVSTDAASTVVQFETGELDFMMVMTPSNFIPLEESGKYNTGLVTAPHTAYLVFNNELEIFQNKALRQALNYAVDKDTVIEMAYEGLAEPARMMCNDSVFGSDFSGATDFSYNVDKAKEKLAEAGFPNGLNLSDYGVKLEYFGGTYHEKIAQAVQNMWAEIGVDVELAASETIDSDSITGNFTLITEGGAFTADFSYLAKYYVSTNIDSTNYARYRNEEVDKLFAEGNSTTDEAVRKEAYKKICEIVIDDCPHVPIQHKQIPYVWNKDLNAVIRSSNDHPYFIYEWSWN